MGSVKNSTKHHSKYTRYFQWFFWFFSTVIRLFYRSSRPILNIQSHKKKYTHSKHFKINSEKLKKKKFIRLNSVQLCFSIVVYSHCFLRYRFNYFCRLNFSFLCSLFSHARFSLNAISHSQINLSVFDSIKNMFRFFLIW